MPLIASGAESDNSKKRGVDVAPILLTGRESGRTEADRIDSNWFDPDHIRSVS